MWLYSAKHVLNRGFPISANVFTVTTLSCFKMKVTVIHFDVTIKKIV